MKIMTTGGRGFIGSHFVEKVLKFNNVLSVIDYDCMTYAASKSLPFDDNPKYEHVNKNIQDIQRLPPNVDYIVNFAAESHVDNSIASPSIFIESNILGVYNLLELIRGKVYSRPQLIHISTDEVYGDADDGDNHFDENHKLTPSNPYAGSKAAAEMMIMSYGRTFGIDYKITRSTNNYGPRQYPEKLIPKCIDSIKSGKKIPLHGDGSYVRDWIHVEDNVSGIWYVLEYGENRNVYNISGNNPLSNIEVVKQVCSWFDIDDYKSHVEFVENRLGQDARYSINSAKAENLCWSREFGKGLTNYVKH